MLDPLSDVIALLRPSTVFSERDQRCGALGRALFGVRASEFLHRARGSCRLAVDGAEPITLEAGDFVLLPATPGFTQSGFELVEPATFDPHASIGVTGEVRHGRQDGPPDVRMLGGYFMFASPDAGLLVSQLPAMIHLRGAERLGTLVQMVRSEAEEDRPGRDLVLARLVEVLLVEALRAVGHIVEFRIAFQPEGNTGFRLLKNRKIRTGSKTMNRHMIKSLPL